MKKLLTELHLMMERIDFHYVATELVKNYNLKSKVKFGTFKKEKGGYNWDKDEIRFKKVFIQVSMTLSLRYYTKYITQFKLINMEERSS